MKKVISIFLILAVCVGGAVGAFFYFTPQIKVNINVNESNQYILSWEDNKSVNTYDILIGDEYLLTYGLCQEIDITEYLIEDGAYQVKVIGYDDQNTEIMSHIYAYNYKAQSVEDFKRQTFFMNGVVCDRYIESTEELKLLIWHTILYQNNNVRFYIATNEIRRNNLEDLVDYYTYNEEDAYDSYPEYDGLYYAGNYTTFENNEIAKLVNFNYYLTLNHTLTTANCTVAINRGLVNFRRTYSQPLKDDTLDMPYVMAADQGTPRTFALEEAELLQVPVYNTEQLMMVVQYGAKPIFPDGYSIVKTVYENAKIVLSQINSDGLTDYEKTLNIYRYLVKNVTYDHVLFAYMAEIRDSSVFSFGNFNVFYMESILYDLANQISVCDGIAKTFTLLCRLEGIESTKINGVAGSSLSSAGNHAWNKVKLGDDYYIVDATWGVNGYAEGTYYDYTTYEFSTHAYFLVSADKISLTHRAIFEIGNEQTINYNYYANQQFEYNDSTVSQYVTSEQELKDILEYLLSQDYMGIELEFSVDFILQMQIKYGYSEYSIVATIINETQAIKDNYSYIDDFTSDGYFVYIFI